MARFRKKAVIVEAEQWFPGKAIAGVWLQCSGTDLGTRTCYLSFPHVHTLEGPLIVSPGDWIIEGVLGERYPCRPDVFGLTYDLVQEA